MKQEKCNNNITELGTHIGYMREDWNEKQWVHSNVQ